MGLCLLTAVSLPVTNAPKTYIFRKSVVDESLVLRFLSVAWEFFCVLSHGIWAIGELLPFDGRTEESYCVYNHVIHHVTGDWILLTIPVYFAGLNPF